MCEKKIGRLIMILFLKMCCATVLRKTLIVNVVIKLASWSLYLM